MDELVKLIVLKTGLPEAQARQAAETAVSFLKGKLPAPMASQIDSLLEGASGGGGAAEVMGKLGGLLGG